MRLEQPVLLGLCLAVLLSGLQSQSITRLDKSRITHQELDKKITSLMLAARVHGLGITVFNKNEPVYKRTFGFKNAEKGEPLQASTNIYGASLSKAVFAVLVLKLVEEGVLDLDTPLQQYLPKPIWEYTPTKKWHDDYSDLKGDTVYQRITARMCLSHSSGFPNWRWDNPDGKLRASFTPGQRYSYSGEGLVYLQVVLEHKLGRSLEELMQEKVFRPAGMKQSSYTWQPQFEPDYSWGHNAEGKRYKKDKDNDARSASTLETTLDDYTAFTKVVLQHKLISPASTHTMFTPQMRLRSVQQFGPNRFRDTTANDGIALSSALGWLTLQSPYGRGVFKEGHGDGFQHYTILFPQAGTGIVLMTNSDNGERIFRELLQTAIGDTFTPWYWENYIPYDQKN